MPKIKLFAETGFYDLKTLSSANLYQDGIFVHGSGVDSDYEASAYFTSQSLNSLTSKSQPNIALTILQLPYTPFVPFTVTISIGLDSIGAAEMMFYVSLNPDDNSAVFLPPISKKVTDRELSFEVTTPTTNGDYYINVYAVLSSSQAFKLKNIIISY